MKKDGCACLVMEVVTRPLLLSELDSSNEKKWPLSPPGVVKPYEGKTRNSLSLFLSFKPGHAGR